MSSSASGSSGVIAASASHSKVPGTAYLDLGKKELRWVPQSSSLIDQAFTLPFQDIDKLLAGKGKPGATTFSLKIVRFPGTGSDPIITFTAPEGRERAEADRERFKEHLFAASVANKEGATTPAPKTPVPSGSATPAGDRSTSRAPEGRGTKEGPTENQLKDEIQLRIAVLEANPDLQALHKELVFKKVMKDKEFWSHPSRAALLRAERMARAQRRGRNARIADPRPTNDSEGKITISLSAELVRDVFEQYPLVAKAYNELVPNELDEQSFWTRYFQSRLYHRLRTSARSAASEHITRADPLFDRYLADVVDDSDLESRRKHNVHDTFLDLGATQLDHEDTGNTHDYTMRAGFNRSNLPLLRHFNTHSTSLLDSALGQQAAAPGERRVTGGVGEEYTPQQKKRAWDQIIIEELEPSRRKKARPLQVADDRQAFFQGRDGLGGTTEQDEISPEEAARVLATFGRDVDRWATEAEDVLNHFTVTVQDNERAQLAIDATVRDHRVSEEEASSRSDLPEEVYQSLTSAQASTAEFLRQFWVCVAPDATVLKESTETDAQRRARAQKMLDLLRETQGTMHDVAAQAEKARLGAGRERIQIAIQPTISAVNIAIKIGSAMFS